MSENESTFTNQWWLYPPLRNSLLAAVIGVTAFLLEYFHLIPESLTIKLYWLAIVLAGLLWTKEGIEELFFERKIGISMLMIGATVGAGYLGMWDEAVALVVLYGLAEGIEAYTFNRTRNAIRSLLDLAPKVARVIKEEEEILIPAESLNKGDKFIVLPGESLATDGIIIEGNSTLDESAVTGESVPVNKKSGDKVFAASINGEATLKIESTASFADNSLSKIIELVENAQDQKGRAQEWMERFGQRYSPLVLITAFILVVLPLFFQLHADYWTEKAVILLVTAAPCALVISLPIAMSAGISGAGKRGVLIKGGAHLEHLGTIKTIAFDKTGTLTYGRPIVTDMLTLKGDESDCISIASGIEKHSAHPLAKAVVNYAHEKQVKPLEAKDTKAIIGAGTQGDINGKRWYLASPSYFIEKGYELEVIKKTVYDLQKEGKTVVLLGNEESIYGLLALKDVIRENAPKVIKQLREMGIKTVMLTGDNEHTAQRIAKQIGIDDVRANLKPNDKVRAIEELLHESPTLMVGDGINDAPALAQATCGVAMGAAGTDAAIEAADIALMADDLDKLIEAIVIGKKAKKVSRENIIFSLTVLAVLIPAGLGGFISVAVAVLVHEVSELLAVVNGLRSGKLAKVLYT
jgi:Cd2+/Zn2+-exporting ATPase